MSIEKRRTKDGTLFRFDKMIWGVRLKSPFIFRSKREVQDAQAAAVTAFRESGKITTRSALPDTRMTVLQLLTARVAWLKENRSKVHANNNASLFKLALAYAPEWAKKPVIAITLEMVREWAIAWKRDLESRGKTAKTVNKALVAFQSTWNHPWDSRRAKPTYPNNPFAEFDRFPVEKNSKYVPETSMVNRLMDVANIESPDLSLYLQIMFETGARPGEPLKLKWKDISSETQSLALYTKKKKGGQSTSRRLAVSNHLVQMLDIRHDEQPNSTFVFQQSNKVKPIALDTINDIFKRICTKAGVTYFPLYGWRHWRASKWAQEGKSLPAIQAKLGHEQATMTNTYLHELRGS